MTTLGIATHPVAPGHVAFVLLGTIQDGGLPHSGCACIACRRAHADASARGLVASAAIVDRRHGNRVWMIDASPDITAQLWILRDVLVNAETERLRAPDGVFLTHGHMGHIAGLAHFGTTSMHTPPSIWADTRLLTWLEATNPWGLHFDPHALHAEKAVELSADVQITPLAVPHRDETATGTFAFFVAGPTRRILYVPDIDSWAEWPDSDRWVRAADTAVVDGCFYDDGDRPRRPEVVHPTVVDTLTRFAHGDTRIVLTHLNHTNPLLHPTSESMKRIASAHTTPAGTVFEL